MEEKQGKGRGLSGSDRKTIRRPFRLYRFAILNGVALLLVGLAYGIAPDFAYALTIWPCWVWAVVALWLLLIGIRRRPWRWTLASAFAWFLLSYLCNSEVRGLVRTIRPAAAFDYTGIRVSSLNCAGGNPAGIREAHLLHQPDVLLLQESPSEAEIRKVLKEYGSTATYSLLAGPDASIIVFGSLEPVELPKGTTNFVCARARLDGHGLSAFIVSLRLAPPTLRFDYWNPVCWSAYAESKRRRRQELEEILEFIEGQDPGAFVIIGGDFNTPPDPSIQGKLRASYTDTFAQSGRGYGATAVAGFPMVRIDQIWFRGSYWTWKAGVVATPHSDHLMATASLAPMRKP